MDVATAEQQQQEIDRAGEESEPGVTDGEEEDIEPMETKDSDTVICVMSSCVCRHSRIMSPVIGQSMCSSKSCCDTCFIFLKLILLTAKTLCLMYYIKMWPRKGEFHQ